MSADNRLRVIPSAQAVPTGRSAAAGDCVAHPGAGGGPARFDPLDPRLPVAGTGILSEVRKSKRGPWRAVALATVHILFLVHIAHYMIAGRTLSPVEPSESMYTLELGWVNAGFIFFALAILSTLIFGRFFCGWGCHLIALQDLCAWFMKKLGIRPRPFRSRLLLLVPAALGFYMFFWPTLRRLLFHVPAGQFPGFTNHLVTADFWRTFASPLFAALTFLTCGVAAVYFLGAKGFCTYGCPYGAIFGAADRLSVGRITVNDACNQCGHCTATCTSNVVVHEEVRRYGMIVDPGCMKCTDCVSVCPTKALSFSFGRPSLLKRRPTGSGSRRYALGLGAEILLGAVCVAATLAFRGLYDGPPLLMAVGLGGITAFVAIKLLHLSTQPTVRIQNLDLKLGGKIGRAGVLFAAAATAWLLFTGHSAFVQWHRARGARNIDLTMAARADVLSGAAAQRLYPEGHDRAVRDALRHFTLADRWGLFGVAEVKLGLAWCFLLRNDSAAGEAKIREAIALAPRNAELRQDLVDLFVARGRIPEAIDELKGKLALETGNGDPAAGQANPDGTAARASIAPAPHPATLIDAGLGTPGAPAKMVLTSRLAADQFALGELLAQQERFSEAAGAFSASVALSPASAAARFNYGGVLRRLGRNEEAIVQLRAAADLAPQDADTQIEIGLACMAAGRKAEALAALRQAIAIAPDSLEARVHLPDLIRQLEQVP